MVGVSPLVYFRRTVRTSLRQFSIGRRGYIPNRIPESNICSDAFTIFLALLFFYSLGFTISGAKCSYSRNFAVRRNGFNFYGFVTKLAFQKKALSVCDHQR